MTLAGVSPGGLQSAVESVLVSHAGQSAGSYNYTVISRLALINSSSIDGTDQNFINGSLSRLSSLDLSGHVPDFAVDFQNIRTLNEVTLPANVNLADTMFNGCSNLVRIMFLGGNAPAISANALSGVSAAAFVPNAGSGGYESPEFTGRFSSVQTIVNPSFSTQPQNQTVTVGQDASFTVAASGVPGPALQWQVSSNGGGSFNNIDGQTGTTLRLTSVNQNQNNNQYRCVATSMAGEVISAAATLTAGEITNAQTPRITSQPAGGAFVQNNNVTLSVTAEVTDGGTLSYQWFSSTTDRNNGGTLIQGATSRTYSPPTNAEGTIFYYVEVTNTNNTVSGTRTATVASNTAKIEIKALVNTKAPEITGQPLDNEIVLDDEVTLSVQARSPDEGTLSFQWFRSGIGIDSGDSLINGATESLFKPPTDTLGTIYYYVVVTNTNNDVTGVKTANIASDTVPVTVITTPEAPQSLHAAVNGNQVVLSWDLPADDGGGVVTGYQVSDNIVTFWIDADGMYEHTFSDLNYEVEYTFRVRAVNNAGFGEEAELTAKTGIQEHAAVQKVYLNIEKLFMLVGDTDELIPFVTPENAEDQSVKWTSDDPTIAEVNSHGIVTAVAAGTATITVTTNDGGHTATCVVSVEKVGDSHNPTLWIVLGSIALVGAGTGAFFWIRSRRS